MHDNIEQIGCFEVVQDPYNGLTIIKESIPTQEEVFIENLNGLIQTATKDQRRLLWLYLDIQQSYLIPCATTLGFEFHTCEKNQLLLVKRLVKNAIIPTASNHTLGVGVVVFNEHNELLVIKERFSNIGFKLPGGHIDDAELIQNAAIREVKEETGIDITFESIISIGHFYPHQFNKSNLYILCRAKALSHEIKIEDTDEILACKWVDIDEYLADEEVFEYSKAIVQTARDYKGLEVLGFEILRKLPKENYELFFPLKKEHFNF